MTPAEIKRKRTESALREVLPEAFAMLDDTMLNTLIVNDVVCSRGRYDAKVYLDKTGIDESKQKQILEKLKRVKGFLKNYVRETQGWYRAPNFTFDFDDQLDRISRIEELFKQIEGNR